MKQRSHLNLEPRSFCIFFFFFVLAPHLSKASTSDLPSSHRRSPSYDYETTIVHGETARPGMHPWQVTLRKLERRMDSVFIYQAYCGGVLISARQVLTAAHCVKGFDSIRVYGGGPGTMSGQRDLGKVNSSLVHPDYQHWVHGIKQNDLALLTLKTPIQKGPSISPVPLLDTSPGELHKLGEIRATGFGKSHLDPETPEELQITAPLKLLPEPLDPFWGQNGNIERYIVSGDYGNSYDIWATYQTGRYLALIDEISLSSACFGDSGGPLVTFTDHGIFLIGITSHTSRKDCGLEVGGTSFFTNLSQYLSWIRKEVPDVQIGFNPDPPF